MNTNSTHSPISKNENHTNKSTKSHLTNFADLKSIKSNIKDGSKSIAKEIKSKTSEAKTNMESYIKAHPFKCLVYAAISAFIFSKFI